MTHHSHGAAAAVLAVAAAVSPLPAQELQLPPIPIDTFTLANGLRVIVSEDHSAPVVAVNLWYRVGSAHEAPGRSGFAHLFEHMLFEETENLADGELAKLVSRAGGRYNGTTDTDRTAYYEVLPANRVNLALWLHAERMDRLEVTERGFTNQREVVKEERRLRVDNQPYGQAQLTLDTLSTNYEPYRHTTIGSMADLDAAEVGDVGDFYERYYVPNNATLVVAGDVTGARVRELVEEYFGAIPAGQPAPPLPAPPPVPRTDGERTAELSDPLAQLPLLYMAYTVPPASHEDMYALSLLSTIFSGGESSRLYRRLVKDDQIAPTVISFLNRRLGPGTMIFGSLPNQGGDVDGVRAVIEDEIEKLKTDGVTERELEKALNQRRSAEVGSRMSVASKANDIQWHALHFGDPFHVNTDLARYESVTLEDIRRVARKYLVPENRAVVVVRPEGAAIS